LELGLSNADCMHRARRKLLELQADNRACSLNRPCARRVRGP